MPGQGDRSASSSVKSVGKAQQITVGGKSKSKSPGRFPVRQPSDSSTLTAGRHAPMISSPLAGMDAESESDADEHERARKSLVNTSKEISTPPATQPLESPFFDTSEALSPPSSSSSGSPFSARVNPYASMAKSVGTSMDDRPKRGGKGMGGLSDIIEEATKRASRIPSHDGLGGKRDLSPFSDVHELDER